MHSLWFCEFVHRELGLPYRIDVPVFRNFPSSRSWNEREVENVLPRMIQSSLNSLTTWADRPNPRIIPVPHTTTTRSESRRAAAGERGQRRALTRK